MYYEDRGTGRPLVLLHGAALPAFSVLAGLHARVERRAATRVVLSRLPGFETGAAGAARDAPELALGEALVVFPGTRGEPEPASALLRALQDPDAEVLHDIDAAEIGRAPRLDSDPRIGLAVSRGWLGGERHRHDRALCAC